MNDAAVALPEIVMVLVALGLLGMTLAGRPPSERVVYWGAAGLMAILALWVALDRTGRAEAFAGAFIDDPFARFAKVLVLASAALLLAMGRDYLSRNRMADAAYPMLIILAVVGMMIMTSAGDLLVMVLGLEIQAIALAVLAGFNRRDASATEASVKLLVQSGLASAVLIYGVVVIYGFAGSIGFQAIAGALSAERASMGLSIGLILVVAGLAAKVGAAPFHLARADIAEGAPSPAAAFLMTVPAIAALVLLARVGLEGSFGAIEYWRPVLVFVAVLSMLWGVVAALAQANLKRFFAYATTAQLGFPLAGLAAGDPAGAQALLVYLVVIAITNAGFFAFIFMVTRDGRPVDRVSDLTGFARTHSTHGAWLVLILVSMAGLPPMLGFFAKYTVIAALVQAGLAPLALIASVAWLIGAYVCLRITALMFEEEPEEPLTLRARPVHGLALSGAAIVLASSWLPFIGDFGVPDIALAAAEGLVE